MQLITNSPTVVILSDQDSVAVARRALARGSRVESLGLEAQDDIPAGHKIARRAIAAARQALLGLRRSEAIGDDAFHLVEEELDRAELSVEA